MALTNSQYNELMRRYSRTRFQHQHEMEERLRHIYAKCPRLLEISQQLPTASASLAKAKITGNAQEALKAQASIDALRKERTALLASLHYTLKDLQPKYSCPDCKDTGYLDGNRKCHCFEQAGISLLYEQSGIRDRLEKENFSTFDINRYSDAPNPLLGGMSNRTHMQRLRLIYEKYACQFEDGSPSLLIFGNPGVGKTFLCNCIAKVVLDRGFSVLYMTAPEFFESAMQRFHSNTNDDSNDNDSYALTCSLLIIDDLGTENLTPFVISQLFHVINSRDLAKKTTIISTNLSPDQLQNTYTERISSRLMGQYTAIPIFGDDLRNS